MQTADLIRHAHALYRLLGDKAEAVAATRARTAKQSDQAETWTAIRRHIRELRGARLA